MIFGKFVLIWSAKWRLIRETLGTSTLSKHVISKIVAKGLPLPVGYLATHLFVRDIVP